MANASDLESATLSQRFALLGLVELQRRGETPADCLAVRDCCVDHLDELAIEVIGRPAEADVTRALNELAVTDLVSETRTDPSATGKGRPEYEVRVDEEAILAVLADDDRLRPVVDRVRESRA